MRHQPESKSSIALTTRIGQIILFCGPMTTFLVNPWTNYDPIGLVKLIALSSFGVSVLFLIIFRFSELVRRIPKRVVVTAFCFVGFMISTLVLSGAPLNQQIWGSFGRNTGLLTYISLLSLFLGSVLISERKFYDSFLQVFVSTSVLMTIYCSVQFLNLDPIRWSEQGVFGTLGNINFLSAYFGMTSLAIIALVIAKRFNGIVGSLLILKVLWDLYLVASTKSIQGLVLFLAGLVFLGLLLIRMRGKFWISSYFILSLLALCVTILGLLDRGPFAKILFQPSVVFRGDYMHAGFAMTLKSPFFGIGMDSYGDWYRQMRGEISTLRTGPDRISNTAHNLFLDISSNGGFPLLICYLLLNLFVLYSIFRMAKEIKFKDPIFLALSTTWFGYLVQSIVSINQIGVGIWGWLFGGAIIGYSQSEKNEKLISYLTRAKRKSTRNQMILKPAEALVVFLGFSVGFTAAMIPVRADAAFRAANDRRDAVKMRAATEMLGSTAFHSELFLDFTMRNNLVADVKPTAIRITEKYPRDFFAWRVLSVASESTTQERNKALERAKTLDPYNPQLKN